MKRPTNDKAFYDWFRFWSRNWRNSQAIKLASMRARGVMLEIEILMARSPQAGFLLMTTGIPIDEKMLARLADADDGDMKAGLEELEKLGEIRFHDGIIFCERVKRQTELGDYFARLAKLKNLKHGCNLNKSHERPARAKRTSNAHEHDA
jgi:hypothetical protein